MTKIFESTIEEFVIELLQNQWWLYLVPEEQELERLSAFWRDRFDAGGFEKSPQTSD